MAEWCPSLNIIGDPRATGAQHISPAQRAGLKDPQHARPVRARGILPPLQGGIPVDWSFPARCTGLVPFGAFSAENKLAPIRK
jgi:hypothetical protein